MLFAVSFPLLFFELFNLTFVVGFINESETLNLHRFAFPETFFNCSAVLFRSHCSAIQVSDLRLIFYLFNFAVPSTSACRLLILNDFDYHRFLFLVAQNDLRILIFQYRFRVGLVLSLLCFLCIGRAFHCFWCG